MKTRGAIVIYLCAVLVAVCAINVQTPQKVVEAPRGKSATLPCTYQTIVPDTFGGNAIWYKEPDQIEAISTFFGAGVNHSDPAYEGRVAFTGNVYTNDATIVINQLTMEDNGTYSCEITLPKDRSGTRQAKMELVVLVAPSKPECAIVGTAEYGQAIQLTCASKEGSPPPTYAWESFSPQNVPRPLPATATTEGGVLSLKNISMETSGFFICTSKNRIGQDSCNMTLAVMPRRGKRGAGRGRGRGRRPWRGRPQQSHNQNTAQEWWNPPQWQEYHSPARQSNMQHVEAVDQGEGSTRKRPRQTE